jgi:hypothetical protein
MICDSAAMASCRLIRSAGEAARPDRDLGVQVETLK